MPKIDLLNIMCMDFSLTENIITNMGKKIMEGFIMKSEDHLACDKNMNNWFNSMFEGFALLEMIVDTSGNPIDYRYLDVNNAFEKMMELTRTQIIGKTVTDMVDEEDIMLEPFAYVALEGKPLQFEHYFKKLNKYFRISAYSPSNGRFITLITDITDLKIAEDTLKMHHILFENAKDIILYINELGDIITANKNALKTYGYTDEEMRKLNVSDLRHPTTLNTFKDEMKSADENGVIFETLHIKKDNTIFPVEVSVKGTIIDNKRIRMHIVRDITQRKKDEEKILYLANHDILTGIANRGYLMKQIASVIEQANMTKQKFALMLFDIDKFKPINDIYGHNVGDLILKNTARSIANTLRKNDILGRYGGDEFVIVQPFINSEDDVKILTKRIIGSLKTPINLKHNSLNISISLGISIYPNDADNIKDLLFCADNAMYEVKRLGGNGFKFSSSLLF